MSIDQFRDTTGIHLYNLVKDRPQLEELIKEAEVTEDQFNALPDTAFAWPEKRAFATHTKEHTILSRLYREKLASVPAHVDMALKEAYQVYELDDNLFARAKVASKEDATFYLLPEDKKLSIKTANDLETVQRTLLSNLTKLSVENRALACTRLLDKAREFDKVAMLSPVVHKYAGYSYSDTQVLRDWLGARVTAARDNLYKAAYEKLATEIEKFPKEIRERDGLVKLADTIAELDKAAGLDKLYDKKILDPMATVFNTEKIASSGVDLNGKFVPMQRLASYEPSFYGDILGDDVVRDASINGALDIQKLATIIGTLPRDLKNILAKQMNV